MRFFNTYVTTSAIDRVVEHIINIQNPPASLRWWVRHLTKLNKEQRRDYIKEILKNYTLSIREFTEERVDIKLDSIGSLRYSPYKEHVYRKVIAKKIEAQARGEIFDMRSEAKDEWAKLRPIFERNLYARVNSKFEGKTQVRRSFEPIPSDAIIAPHLRETI